MNNKKISFVFFGIMSIVAILFFAACTQSTVDSLTLNSIKIVVEGYEWGPAVSALVIEFDKDVSGVETDTFVVKTSKRSRTVTDAYNSDESGKRVDCATKYITLELSVKYDTASNSVEASPFFYDINTGRNTWNKYTVNLNFVQGKSLTLGLSRIGGGTDFSYTVDCEKDRIIPQIVDWAKDTYTYTNGNKKVTLSRASWAPNGVVDDGVKNPVIIWLHGGGEGGTDIDIALLGGEVTALTTENDVNVQKYFRKDGCAGAYVFAVQAPTMWMDKTGNGEYNTPLRGEGNGTRQDSYYTEALFEAISDYVDNNTDIDKSRIYIGGCSNGGYMTLNLALTYEDYFAAYYPICQGYKSINVSDEALQKIAKQNIWFVLSVDDNTIAPDVYTLPLYARLVSIGASNVHLTLFDRVTGMDCKEAVYAGHWAWVKVLNDEVKKQFDNELIAGEQYLVPENCNKDGNLWQWLS